MRSSGLAGDLGAAGVVEEDGGTVEGGELFADEGKVEGHEGTPWLDYNFPWVGDAGVE